MHGSPLCCQRHCAHSRLSQGFGPCLPRPSSGPDSLSPVEDRLLPANPPASCGLSSVKDPRLPQRSSQKSQPCPYKSVPHASHLTTILLKSIRGAHFHLPIPSHPPCAHSPKVSAELPSSHPQGPSPVGVRTPPSLPPCSGPRVQPPALPLEVPQPWGLSISSPAVCLKAGHCTSLGLNGHSLAQGRWTLPRLCTRPRPNHLRRLTGRSGLPAGGLCPACGREVMAPL